MKATIGIRLSKEAELKGTDVTENWCNCLCNKRLITYVIIPLLSPTT